MTERLDHGVRRRVTFTPYCHRCPDWEPEPVELKGDAMWFLARHMVDRHGGSDRVGSADEVIPRIGGYI